MMNIKCAWDVSSNRGKQLPQVKTTLEMVHVLHNTWCYTGMQIEATSELAFVKVDHRGIVTITPRT